MQDPVEAKQVQGRHTRCRYGHGRVHVVVQDHAEVAPKDPELEKVPDGAKDREGAGSEQVNGNHWFRRTILHWGESNVNHSNWDAHEKEDQIRSPNWKVIFAFNQSNLFFYAQRSYLFRNKQKPDRGEMNCILRSLAVALDFAFDCSPREGVASTLVDALQPYIDTNIGTFVNIQMSTTIKL